MGDEAGGAGGGEVEGERGSVVFGKARWVLGGCVGAFWGVVVSVSESGSRRRCRLFGFARAVVVVTAIGPFLSQGRVLGMIKVGKMATTVRRVDGFLSDKPRTRRCWMPSLLSIRFLATVPQIRPNSAGSKHLELSPQSTISIQSRS